jgi:ADP-ribose pyrophosphatase YjhB (NUDIX family)
MVVLSVDELIKYCPECGTAVEIQTRFGRPRAVCPACDRVHFQDPKVAACALVEQDGKILLVKRVMMPLRGTWTLPAGFVEAAEDPREAASREVLEETGLHVEIGELCDVIYGREHERGASIVIVYKAQQVGGKLEAQDDAEEARFFGPDEIPDLGFEATKQVVHWWLGHKKSS